MSAYRVAILTLKDDIHALAVQKNLESRGDVVCYIIETDDIYNSGRLTWVLDDCPEIESTVPTRSKEHLKLRDADVIWLRRINYPQRIPIGSVDPIEGTIINNDCRAALMGLALTEFSGTWINEPRATFYAENKLLQLRLASDLGFRTPRTLVSQDPAKIRRFCAMLGNGVVVKTVRGNSQHPLFTVKLTNEMLESDDLLRSSPAIYQEFIPGSKHIRVLCFAGAAYACLIESRDLDWRRNLDVPFSVIELDTPIKEKLQKVLNGFGLKMGVFDLKLDQDASPVWLELNPQGQFLFVEGLTGLKLTSIFSDFLYEEARQASARRS